MDDIAEYTTIGGSWIFVRGRELNGGKGLGKESGRDRGRRSEGGWKRRVGIGFRSGKISTFGMAVLRLSTLGQASGR